MHTCQGPWWHHFRGRAPEEDIENNGFMSWFGVAGGVYGVSALC